MGKHDPSPFFKTSSKCDFRGLVTATLLPYSVQNTDLHAYPALKKSQPGLNVVMWVKPFPNGWFILVLPTLLYSIVAFLISPLRKGLQGVWPAYDFRAEGCVTVTTIQMLLFIFLEKYQIHR
jgi:hypothetical protein